MRVAIFIMIYLSEVGGNTAFGIWPRAALVENRDCHLTSLRSSGAVGDFNRTCEQKDPSGRSKLPALSTASTGVLSGDCSAFSGLNSPVRGVWKPIKELDVTRPGRHGSPYRPQAFISSSAAAFDADRILAALAGKHLLFLGDSVMRQMMEVFVGFLADAGHKASNVTVSVNQEMQVMYANGLVISRWALLHITSFARRSLHLQLAQADVILTGFGRHYNHSSSRAGYTSDLELLATTLRSVAPRRAVLVETLPAHFPTASGDIFDPKRHSAFAMKDKKGYYVCRKTRARGKMWQNTLMHQVASEHHLPVLQVHDIFAARWDAHQGWRGPGDVFRKFGQDCVHWCYSRFLFRPIAAAMQEAVLAATSCNSTTPAMPLGSDTRRTFVQDMIDKHTKKEAARASSSV
ncbi:hypothetical protein CYMTET_27431 [Cymbomonas tetramitiformis]|uniref:Uncharacterized protein n=1 Tax=Cymbomonas tetramitiformis TaxID=36881 RepID=A0AAE0FPW1_9CHLO|nr:hypothetical protein CYMTET_27431 [Cymbomonas tetramitiformis]